MNVLYNFSLGMHTGSTKPESTTNAEPTSSDQSDHRSDLAVTITISVVAVVLITAVMVAIIIIAWMFIRSRHHYTVEAATGYVLVCVLWHRI